MNNYDEIERKIFLIKNYLEDNLSVAEEEELRVWLDESPKHRETFQRIRDKKILFAKLEYRQRQEKETDWKVICRKTGIGSSRRLWIMPGGMLVFQGSGVTASGIDIGRYFYGYHLSGI